jgi:cation diffusion facilitator CzcD-associated flavoprotein CzcO
VTTAREPRVVIIGAGMSGLLMGIRLLEAGIRTFQILEKADRVGGTWRDNRYPGIACDVPSHLYSYSFEPNPQWSHWFSPGEEIQRYFERIADRRQLADHLRLKTRAIAAHWANGQWSVRCEDGAVLQADFLVAATGVLHHPSVPELPGLDTFAGARFHTARWDASVPLDGKRVGVIGTGSTATQITSALVPRVARLSLFQRTPQWIFPIWNPQYSRFTQAVLRRVPGASKLMYHALRLFFQWTFARAVIDTRNLQHRLLAWIARRNLENSVRHPALRDRLRPAYEPGCKRLVFSTDFYEKVQQPNAELVTAAIDRIEPAGVRTKDGRLHELDVLVLATGFQAQSYVRPMRLTTEAGADLDTAWKSGPEALRTMTVPGFPNYFMMVGPYTPIGNFPLISTSEIQARYVMAFVERFLRGDASRFEPRPEALAEFNREVGEAMPRTVWIAGGCSSWYLGASGRPALWPFSFERYAREMRAPRWDEYVVT